MEHEVLQLYEYTHLGQMEVTNDTLLIKIINLNRENKIGISTLHGINWLCIQLKTKYLILDGLNDRCIAQNTEYGRDNCYSELNSDQQR